MSVRAKSAGGKWIGGLAEWDDGDITYLSVAFTWLIPQAAVRAIIAKALGKRPIAGGPALFLPSMRRELEGFAEIQTTHPDALSHHNADATVASRGCPGKGTEEDPDACSHCIVPKMWGTSFTLLPDFPVRPVLCDDNLSALPADYQTHIIRRYQDAGVKLRDANSGFEPVTFTPDVYQRWKPLVNAGRGPWRFGYDEKSERTNVLRCMRMLAEEKPKRKRIYVLIGNEDFGDCMTRIQEVLDHGCEPHVQPMMKLNALEKEPWVRFGWTEEQLRKVARWANRRIWKYATFAEYNTSIRTSRDRLRAERYDATQGLFV